MFVCIVVFICFVVSICIVVFVCIVVVIGITEFFNRVVILYDCIYCICFAFMYFFVLMFLCMRYVCIFNIIY